MFTVLPLMFSCGMQNENKTEDFEYNVEKFADLQILRYRVPEFEDLTLQQKELVYYLTEAALQGRDILYDQNGKYNLKIRKILEAIYMNYSGDRSKGDFKAFEVYLKRVWFSNGIHHHYGSDKFVPGFSSDFLKKAMMELPEDKLPLAENETAEDLWNTISPIIFDPEVYLARRILVEVGNRLSRKL